MIFGQILKQTLFLKNNTSYANEQQKDLITSKSAKDEAEQLALEQASNLSKDKEFTKALNAINLTIDRGVVTKKLLFQKASILTQLNKYEEAQKIWTDLSKLKNKPKLATSAKKALKESKINQIDSTKRLLNEFHAMAKNYETSLKHIPRPTDWKPGSDIITSIQQEAESARGGQLPMFALELIDKALQAGLESPLLVQDKAVSLIMIGRKKKALSLLNELSIETNNQKIKTTIKKNILKAKKTKIPESAAKKYLFLQSVAVAKANNLLPQFIPQTGEFNENTDIKHLIFKEARNALSKNPNASLGLMNTILTYFPRDLAALQLKGESLAALKKDKEAISILRSLAYSENESIAKEATRILTQHLSKRAIEISSNDSPKTALSFFITWHLECNLIPAMNENIRIVLSQIEIDSTDFLDPELQNHQLQLLFNTHLVECLEARFRERGQLSASPPVQKPAAIRKTAPKAG